MKKPYTIRRGRQVWRNHIRYDWWRYVIFIAVAALGWSMVSTALSKTPPEKKVDVFLLTDYADVAGLEALAEEMLSDFPELLEINFINIPTANTEDYTTQQRLVVNIAAQQGDIFIGSAEEMTALAQQGLFDPLESNWPDNILSSYVPQDQLGVYLEFTESESTPHYYGAPIDQIALLEEYLYAPEHKVMGVPYYSLNKEMALRVMAWLYQYGVEK